MFAVLPLLGGLLLGRFVNDRRVAIAIQLALFAVASAVLIASAPDHGATHTHGLLIAMVLAPVSAATFTLGTLWQHHATFARQHGASSR